MPTSASQSLGARHGYFPAGKFRDPTSAPSRSGLRFSPQEITCDTKNSSITLEFFDRVNLRKKISNPPYLTNAPISAVNSHDAEHTLSGSDLEFWHQVKKDIITIAEIIKNGENEDKEEDLPFLSKLS